MSVLDKSKEITINEKVYNLCFPVRYVFKAEHELANKNLILTMANMPLSYEDTFILFKYGLMGGGVKSEDVEDIFLDALGEHGFPKVFEILLEALHKSGVFGRTKKA